MLRETQTNRTTDSVEQIGPRYQQEFHLRDSTEGETLVWKKVSPNNRMIRSLEELTGMLGHAVYEKSRKVEKQFKKMKRF
jgi:hypothetical protein